MVIFHSYVSLPEGKQFNHQRRPWDPWDPIAEVVLSHGHAVPPFPLGPVRRWLEQLPSSEVSKHLGADKHRTGKFFGPKKLGEFLKNFWEFFFFSESEDGETVVLKIWDLIIFGFETA
jgi:hypothetical protein